MAATERGTLAQNQQMSIRRWLIALKPKAEPAGLVDGANSGQVRPGLFRIANIYDWAATLPCVNMPAARAQNNLYVLLFQSSKTSHNGQYQ